MNKKRFSVRAIFITVLITFLLTGGLGILAARCLLGPGGLAVLDGMRLIRGRFVAEYDPETVVDEALAAMVDSLDERWSVYLTAEQRAAWERSRTNAYVGIGISYVESVDPFGMEIKDVLADSPAQEGGLQIGEVIVAVNGERLTEENFEELTDSIGSTAGETTTLTVQDEHGETREVTLTLRQVEDPPVAYELLEGNIGYVQIENFNRNAAASAQAAVEDLLDQGAEGLLFDVRGNPGGYVYELTDLLDYLLPEGPIFTDKSKNGPTHTVQSDASCVDLPMAVLMDGDSYSAAELFAAQLRESVDAPLVGAQTCGKGYYQQGFILPNGGELHISTGMYGTGSGVSLIGTGLTPDYPVEGWEAQFDKAVEALQEKMKER